MRALLVGGFVLLVCALVFALWRMGGLAKASEQPPSEPGKPVRNALFTITVHDATVVSDTLGPAVQVRADLTSHDKNPVSYSYIDDMLQLTLSPGGAKVDGAMTAALERDPEGFAGDVQPEMPETVLMRWPLPEGTDPDGLEQVRVAVTDAEFRPGFMDQTSYWWSTDKVIDTIAVPIEQS
ncbi:hypothetical protein GCM10022205_13970 [Spinactinospora alkalitolerans]